MRTFTNWTRETIFKSGHFGPSPLVALTWDRRSWILDAEGDAVYTYQRGNPEGCFIVVSVNRRLEYIGAALFDLATHEEKEGYKKGSLCAPAQEIFLQGESVPQSLHQPLENASNMMIVKTLAQWF